MAEILPTITELDVDLIEMGDRLRPVSRAGVEAIKESVRQIGVIKDRIHVRKLKNGKYRLLAGGHRLTVSRELRDEGQVEFATIQVVCWRCNDDFARLLEIDDNLASAELTPLDNAVFLAARKELYERMHPEARQGGARGNQHTGGWQTDTMSFCQTTAEKFGLTDRHIRRLVKAGEAIRSHAGQLRRAPKPVTLADLMAIAKIDDVTERYHVVEALEHGRCKNAAAARHSWKAEQGTGPAPMSQTDKDFLRLGEAFRRASKVARRRWAEENAETLAELLREIEVSEAAPVIPFRGDRSA